MPSLEEICETFDRGGLFHEWLKGVEKHLLELLGEMREPAEIARVLGISEKAMLTLIYRMAQNGSIRITEIRPRDTKERRQKP